MKSGHWDFSHDLCRVRGISDAWVQKPFTQEGSHKEIEKFYHERGVVANVTPISAVSFDIDALDPVFAPGTGTLEVGGYTTLEAQRMIRGLSGLDRIGGDVIEVSPPFDQTGNIALVGATMMFETL